MTRTEAKNILLLEFNSNFDATIPVSYTNYAEFCFTTGIKTPKPTKAPWVRFEIQNNPSDQHTIGAVGGRNFNRLGIISYQVFIPPNKGTYVGDELCEYINNIFEGKRIQNIICETGSWREINNDEGDFYQWNGFIPFHFYQRR